MSMRAGHRKEAMKRHIITSITDEFGRATTIAKYARGLGVEVSIAGTDQQPYPEFEIVPLSAISKLMERWQVLEVMRKLVKAPKHSCSIELQINDLLGARDKAGVYRAN